MAPEHQDEGRGRESLPSPPAQAEHPRGAVVAVIDDLRRALRAADAARTSSDTTPFVVEASEVLREDARRDEEMSVLGRIYLTLGQMVSDERTLESQYVDEARKGHHMVVTSARDDTQALQLWELLRSFGAHHGTYHGPLTIRDLR